MDELSNKVQRSLVEVLSAVDFENLSISEWEALYQYGKLKTNRIKESNALFNRTKTIKTGSLVHLVFLSTDKTNNDKYYPIKIVLNHVFERDLNVSDFNDLNSHMKNSPGSWFIRNGYRVNSALIDEHWVQVAHAPGFTNIESYIDYIEDEQRRESTETVNVGRHFDGIKSFHLPKTEVVITSSNLKDVFYD